MLRDGKLHCPLTILAAFLLMLTLAMPTLAAADEGDATDASDDDDTPDDGDDNDIQVEQDDSVLPEIDISGESEDEEDDGSISAGDTVVVTGTRTKHQASDAPVSTSVVTRQQVENSGAVDAGDALLVCRQRDAQRVRDIAAAVERRGSEDLL